MIHDRAEEVIEKHFKSFQNKYQNNFEVSIKASVFVFDCLSLLPQNKN